MSHPYCHFFGFKLEPFNTEISTKNVLKLPSMVAVKERFDYVLSGGVLAITGEVGSGKSTSLRWAQSVYHPSQYLFINVTGSGGSLAEFYRQICWGFEIDKSSGTRTILMKYFKNAIREISSTRKQKIVLIVDEAQLLRTEVFAEIHTITQFENDSKNLLSIILSGQPALIDKLTYRTSQPLASRVIAKTHLQNLNQDQTKEYLVHHLNVAGCKNNLFSDQAMTAIYQGSAGILRKINSLARGGLIAAMTEKQQVVTAEHIRIASTEIM